MTGPEYKYLTYEPLDEPAIVRIMLNRPNARNAQNRGLPVELGQAFARAEEDDTARVVILARQPAADGHAWRRRDRRLADQPAGAARREKPRRRRGPGGVAG
jgi:enoyl-CoA hydratase/carnithine racemase